ncbi:MAG TPA: hypothetical protein PKD76_07735 [Solirubrobacterales bacterium]|nr:hypothetical protein [Solirubrobacterales bacterium]
MLKDLGELRVDRKRAIRIAAIAGLTLLGISTLPGLLETPDPPPVPADVGFRPEEMASYTSVARPEATLRRKAAGGRPTGSGHLRNKAEREPRPGERTGSRKGRGPGQGPKRRAGKDAGDEEASGSAALAPSSAPAPALPVTPTPAYSPPVSNPEPVPSPAVAEPAVDPPPLPSDGSQEFAPR